MNSWFLTELYLPTRKAFKKTWKIFIILGTRVFFSTSLTAIGLERFLTNKKLAKIGAKKKKKMKD